MRRITISVINYIHYHRPGCGIRIWLRDHLWFDHVIINCCCEPYLKFSSLHKLRVFTLHTTFIYRYILQLRYASKTINKKILVLISDISINVNKNLKIYISKKLNLVVLINIYEMYTNSDLLSKIHTYMTKF